MFHGFHVFKIHIKSLITKTFADKMLALSLYPTHSDCIVQHSTIHPLINHKISKKFQLNLA